MVSNLHRPNIKKFQTSHLKHCFSWVSVNIFVLYTDVVYYCLLQIITFSIVNSLNALLCIAHAVFLLPRAFWFKDFLTLSKCRDDNPDGHGLAYDRTGKGRADVILYKLRAE